MWPSAHPSGLGRPALEGKSRGLGAGRARPGGLGCSGWEVLGRELGRVVVMPRCPQLLGLWDSPRSRALLPKLLRADRSVFCARRDVSRRCRLRPGHYLVVPSASQEGDEADFTLRIFSERSHTAV